MQKILIKNILKEKVSSKTRLGEGVFLQEKVQKEELGQEDLKRQDLRGKYLKIYRTPGKISKQIIQKEKVSSGYIQGVIDMNHKSARDQVSALTRKPKLVLITSKL